MKIGIKGIGVLGGFGCGAVELERALACGSSPQCAVALETLQGNLAVPALTAHTERLSDFAAKGALRRLDHYIRLALLGSYLALEDAGMLKVERRRMGIIVATGYGSTCNMMDIQQALNNDAPAISPTRFSNSVHNAAATHISILLDEMGPSLSVNDFDMSIPTAFLSACQWLREKRVDSVLVGGVDEYCRALGYNWHRRYRSGEPSESGPFDLSTGHAVVGEGACFFLLTPQAAASPYGVIEEIRMGSAAQSLRGDAPEDAVHFLGVDAYSEYDEIYAACLPRGAQAASYTHLYGAIPIGMGFDIAIAALSLRAGKIYASGGGVRSRRLEVIRRETRLAKRDVCCLKIGAGGVLGSVRLTRP